jgi:hypothetical protein
VVLPAPDSPTRATALPRGNGEVHVVPDLVGWDRYSNVLLTISFGTVVTGSFIGFRYPEQLEGPDPLTSTFQALQVVKHRID